MGRYDRFTGAAATAEDFSSSPPSGEVPSGSRYSTEKLFPPPPPPPPTPTAVYRSHILPFTKYSDNRIAFEPFSSGLVGGLIQSVKGGVDYAHRASRSGNEALSDVRNPGAMGEILNLSSLGLGTNPFVRSGDRAIPGVAGVKRDLSLATVPTHEELKRIGGQQIEAVRELPVQYNPHAFGVLADQTEQELLRHGVFPHNSPQLYGYLDQLRKSSIPPGYESIHAEPTNLIAARENLAGLFTTQGEKAHGVNRAFKRLNEFIENPPEGTVLAGPAADVGALYAKGRANYAAGLRGEELADIRRRGEFKTAASNSGQNADNTLRQQTNRVVLDDEAMRGYIPSEVAAIEKVPLGTPVRNTLRWAGNFLGGGGGLGASTTGAMGTGLAHFLGAGDIGSVAIGAAAPAAGVFLKNQAAKGTAGALQAVEEATRRRSPLFQESLANAPGEPGWGAFGRGAPQDLIPANPGRDAMARRLLQMELTTPPEPPPSSGPLKITVRPQDRPFPYDPENYL